MTIELLISLAIAAVNNSASLMALYQKMKAEGRNDLTPDEVAAVRASALSSQQALVEYEKTMP